MASSSTKPGRGADRRARAEAARRAAERAEQRRRLLVVGGAGLVAVLVVVILVVVALVTRPSKTPTFAAPSDPVAAIKGAGLQLLSAEGEVLHVHDHLDVYVDGKHVTVPANIGIASSGISALHTHDDSGVIHVESPVKATFTLGQFLKEWQVPVTADCVKNKCGGVTAYLNGKKVADANAIQLKGHQELVITVGKAPKKIPSSYEFPAGE